MQQSELLKLVTDNDGVLVRISGHVKGRELPIRALDSSGYVQCWLQGKKYAYHRIVYLYHHGYLPEFLDHIDGDRTNNIIDNLRAVTRKENNRNKCKPCSNTTGVIGVVFRKDKNKYMAQIGVDKKNIHLGSFNTLDEAAQARKEAEVTYGFHVNHGRD